MFFGYQLGERLVCIYGLFSSSETRKEDKLETRKGKDLLFAISKKEYKNQAVT